MSWIDGQADTLLRSWIKRTKTPMLVAVPDGKILWCNEAFEDLVGWNSVELVGKKSLRDITDDSDDLEADEALAKETVSGERTNYQLHTPYRTKNGTRVRVIIDAVRYPHRGGFECFLISAIPTDRGVHFALGQLSEIHSLMLQMIEGNASCKPDRIDSFFSWVTRNPKCGWPIIGFFAILLFGSRVIELLKEVFPTIGQ